MDRRQRKTRDAIFRAFIGLLSEKRYHQITVGDILSRADIGRATFYAHFETKDYLLRALCRELFTHVFEAEEGGNAHNGIFACDAPRSVYLHLVQHLQNNDNHILQLLSGQNNELFLQYFKSELKLLAEKRLDLFAERKPAELPEDFWVDHICSTFVETIRWWLTGGRKESPETITKYFFLAV